MIRTYELLREAYRPIFEAIVFTGGPRPMELPGDELWVECNGSGGSMMQACLANVMQVQKIMACFSDVHCHWLEVVPQNSSPVMLLEGKPVTSMLLCDTYSAHST